MHKCMLYSKIAKQILTIKEGVGGIQRWGKKGWNERVENRGWETNGGCSRASRHRVCVCVCVCLGRAQWESLGHGGRDQSFGASSTGNREDGEKGMGEGRHRVKGRDVVSFKFENLRGEEQQQRGGEEVSAEDRRGTKRRGGKRRGEEVRRGELRRRESRRGGER